MRISAKARYGLAAAIKMAELHDADKCITILKLSETLQISKIYLEQVFALLKRGGIVISVKGARGGYLLSRPASEISVYDVLSAIELSIFEKTEQTVSEKNTDIEKAMQTEVFSKLDAAVIDALAGISIGDISAQAMHLRDTELHMYYI